MQEISNSSDSNNPGSRLLISGDIEPYRMPDGTIISGRAAQRQYYKEHNVTHVSDYNTPGGYWDKLKAQRERAHTPGAGFDSERRREHLKRAYDKLRK
jgi:hypothetical protein